MRKLLEYILFPTIILPKKTLKNCLSNKTILITGATFGIGETISKELANSGANLILVARTQDKLVELKKYIENMGGTCYIFPVNLYCENSVNELLIFLNNLNTNIDIFINNAGKSIRRSIFQSLDRYHDFTRTNSINYLSPIKILLHLIPQLSINRGQIINISAINTLLYPAPKWAAYQASKTAFDHWLKSVKPELNSKNISVSTVYLPLVKTRMISPTEHYKKYPMLQPKDVSNIVLRMIGKKSIIYKPWWTIFPQLFSVISPRITEYFLKINLK